jgi:glucose-1-phosphate cytidylyltransferase
MRTVVLCGGFGTRIRDVADDVPKPMVRIGDAPILEHLLGSYARRGHDDFVLCLGYKGASIVAHFAARPGTTTGGDGAWIHEGRLADRTCRVVMVDTGLHALTGARIRRVRDRVGDDTFMLTYGDGLGNVDLAALVAHHRAHGKLLTVTGVRPPSRFGELQVDDAGSVVGFNEKSQTSGGRISGGFFVCEPGIFDYLDDREDLMWEKEPIQAIVKDHEMTMYAHDGFWQCMDTYREWQLLSELWATGDAPWLR